MEPIPRIDTNGHQHMNRNIILPIIGSIVNFIRGIKEFNRFLRSFFVSFKSLRYLRFRSLYTIAVNQTKFTGIDALSLIVVIAMMLGATVIVQATKNFPKFGIEGFIGNLLVIIIARELGPLVTAVIVVSRSGSAIAAEIATQKQRHEIHSLELMGIDTTLYIIFPRMMASVFSIFSLMVIFDMVAFFGGYLIALTTVFIPIDIFFASLLDSFSFEDLVITILKSFIYGTLIPLICCYYGFKPTSDYEIPIYVSKAVVRTLLILFVINAIVSALFYF